MPLNADPGVRAPALRDPAARGRVGWLLLALVLLWPLLQGSGFRLAPLLDPDNLRVIGNFLANLSALRKG